MIILLPRKEFGKGVGQDLVEGKMTLPLYYSIESASLQEQSKINEILAKEEDFSEDELSFVRGIVTTYNGVQKTNDMAESFVDKAKSAISMLPDSNYKNSLISLADFIVERRT